MKNREKWATPSPLLSPLPKRNIKKPWRGVGCQRSAPVFVRSLLPGHSPRCPPVPGRRWVRLARDSHLESEQNPQKQKPHSTPDLGSPDQSSLFDLMRGPQACLGTCWRPAAPEAQTQGTTPAQPRPPQHRVAGALLEPEPGCGPEASVPRECSPAREQGRPDQLVHPAGCRHSLAKLGASVRIPSH